MSRFSVLLFVCCICLLPMFSSGQKGAITLRSVDSNQALLMSLADMPGEFEDPGYAFQFLKDLVPGLQEKGYLAASIDSIYIENELYGAYVFLGRQYKWAALSFDSIPKSLWAQADIDPRQWQNERLNPKRLSNVSEKLLNWCEENGYPFARVWLDNVQVSNEGGVNAFLMIDKGPYRQIDSINIKGSAIISKNYIMHSLDIFEGEDYNEKKIKTITNRLHEIPFLEPSEPWKVKFKFTTTEIDLYLKERKANQLNAIIGLLPNNLETGKFLLTADVVFAFRNILSMAESIDLTYQQLQYRTPHLKAGAVMPFLFNSPFGIDANFDFFRRDTFFRRTSFQLGLRYQLTATDYVRVFYQNQSNRLIFQDVNYVMANKRLPENVDVAANGGGFEVLMNRTDYRPNPVRGWRGRALTSALLRNVRRSDAISDINDGSGFDYSTLYDSLEKRKYQYRVEGDLAYFIPLGKKATVMTAYYGGWISGNNLFQNELYQIGGFRLMRGFDEQSIYTNQYHILTLELRLLLDRNSNVYLFSDNGYIYSQYSGFNRVAFYNGFGAGASLQVRSGLFTINYALGRTDGTQIQLRQSKIHFGYVAYF